MTFRIRTFEDRDHRQVVDTHVSAMTDAGSYKGEGPWDDDLADIPTHYLRAGGDFLVLEEDDGTLAAIGAYRPDPERPRTAQVKRIRTRPDRQRLGYARAILGALESRAFTAGFRRFRLETTTAQTAAHALYRGCGFRETGRARIMGYDCLLFEKDLTGFRWLLLDVGGVLVRLGGLNKVMEWCGGRLGPEEVGEAWLRSAAVRAFETGATGLETFARDVVAEFGFPVTTEEFLKVFDGFMGGLHPGARETLDLLTVHFDVATLSNGNDRHWTQLQREYDFEGRLRRNFLSFRIGVMKPDPEAFGIVLRELGCRPCDILFFDDSWSNVNAARAAGIKATRAVDHDEFSRALADLGVLARIGGQKGDGDGNG